MARATHESDNPPGKTRQEAGALLSRRSFIAITGGGIAIGAAIYAGIKLMDNGPGEEEVSSVPKPVELSAEATVEEKIRIIAKALSDGRKVADVSVAIDYDIIYSGNTSNRPDGIKNPLILGKDSYGYTTYDDATGKASVLVAPQGGTLEPTAYEPDTEKAGRPEPKPRIVSVDISPVYYESEVYTESGRYYVTAIGEQPGLLPDGADVVRAGAPISIGK